MNLKIGKQSEWATLSERMASVSLELEALGIEIAAPNLQNSGALKVVSFTLQAL